MSGLRAMIPPGYRSRRARPEQKKTRQAAGRGLYFTNRTDRRAVRNGRRPSLHSHILGSLCRAYRASAERSVRRTPDNPLLPKRTAGACRSPRKSGNRDGRACWPDRHSWLPLFREGLTSERRTLWAVRAVRWRRRKRSGRQWRWRYGRNAIDATGRAGQDAVAAIQAARTHAVGHSSIFAFRRLITALTIRAVFIGGEKHRLLAGIIARLALGHTNLLAG
jgi:hypothetical protein